LKALGLVETLFDRYNAQLARRGYVAKAGQRVDATCLEAPRQRNRREANARIKAGEEPDGWDDPAKAPMRRQKDTDARWTKKNTETHYGYKNHVNADQATKLIQRYEVTPAHVHDSQVFETLLDTETADAKGRKRAAYADSAYRSQAHEERLAGIGVDSQIHEKGSRAAPLTDEQKAGNREKSKVRARVEHLFAAQAAMGGHLVRSIGLKRAEVKAGLLNLAYNMRRLVQLEALAARRQGTAMPAAA
jgi:IS5 family transposase